MNPTNKTKHKHRESKVKVKCKVLSKKTPRGKLWDINQTRSTLEIMQVESNPDSHGGRGEVYSIYISVPHHHLPTTLLSSLLFTLLGQFILRYLSINLYTFIHLFTQFLLAHIVIYFLSSHSSTHFPLSYASTQYPFFFTTQRLGWWTCVSYSTRGIVLI